MFKDNPCSCHKISLVLLPTTAPRVLLFSQIGLDEGPGANTVMTTNTTNKNTTPPYVPYATFVSALDALRNHGIPASGKLDKSIWESQSGSVRGQLILAFKFLGLVDDDNRVLPSLPPLVGATSPAERKPLLKKIIEDKYRDVISLNLLTISPAQLQEAFRKLGITGSTLLAGSRFFVKACTELGIPIAQRFSERTRSSSPRGPRKKRAPNGARRSNAAHQNGDSDLSAPIRHSWEAQLLGKFPEFDPSWSEELKTKWFAGFERLMGAKPE